MTEEPTHQATRNESDDELADLRDPEGRGMPRWVKVFGLVALLVIIAVVVLMAVGGGDHGPGQHLPGSPGVDH